jgi:hypothetical protein
MHRQEAICIERHRVDSLSKINYPNISLSLNTLKPDRREGHNLRIGRPRQEATTYVAEGRLLSISRLLTLLITHNKPQALLHPHNKSSSNFATDPP